MLIPEAVFLLVLHLKWKNILLLNANDEGKQFLFLILMLFFRPERDIKISARARPDQKQNTKF